jgi:hypothetical protein
LPSCPAPYEEIRTYREPMELAEDVLIKINIIWIRDGSGEM